MLALCAVAFAVVRPRGEVSPRLGLAPALLGDTLVLEGSAAGLRDGSPLLYEIRRGTATTGPAQSDSLLDSGIVTVSGERFERRIDVSSWPNGDLTVRVSGAGSRGRTGDADAVPSSELVASGRFHLGTELGSSARPQGRAARGRPPRTDPAPPKVPEFAITAVRIGPEPEAVGPELDEPLTLRNGEELSRLLTGHVPEGVRALKQGMVLLAVHVGARGRADTAMVEFSSRSPALDDYALTISKLLRFSTPRRNRIPVDVWTRVPISVERS